MDVLKLTWGHFNLTKNLDLPQFQVLMDEPSTQKCSLKYGIGLYTPASFGPSCFVYRFISLMSGVTGSYDCLRGNFKLERNVGNFFLSKYIPSFLIVCLTFAGFWIPTTAYPARVTLCITALLSLITQQYQTSLNVSYVYALNVWMMMNIFFVFGVLVEYSFAVSDWSERFVIVKGKYDLRHSSRSNSANLEEMKMEQRPSTVSQKKLFLHKMLKSNTKNNSVDMFSRIAFPSLYFIWIIVYIYIYVL
jgi:hypothetical protein